MQGFHSIDPRVMSARTADRSCREVARMFNVSDSSVVKWTRQYKRTGAVRSGKMGGGGGPVLDGCRPINWTRSALHSAFWPPAAGRPKAPPNPTVCEFRGRNAGFQKSNRQPLLGILKFWVAWTIFAPQMRRYRTVRAHGMITGLTVEN